MSLDRIEQNIDHLFSKVNDLCGGMARMDAILPRIEKMLNGLPCEKHKEEIMAVDKEVYAVKHVWMTIIGGFGVLGTVLGLLANWIWVLRR